MATTAESIRRYAGPALFSFGFRPFFLFSALWAAVAVPVWIGALLLGDGTVGGLDGRLWHLHEMLFGFVGGVIAGFLLTAVPNWTGRLPVTGRGLAALFALWAAGRIGMLAPPPLHVVGATVDSAFLVVFAAVVWREILAAGNRRNLPVCVMVSVLALANILFHLRGLAPEAGPYAERGAVAVISLLIALIGGRVTPSFTTNWTKAHRHERHPVPFNRFDQGVLGATGAALVAWTLWPDNAVTGALLAAVGGLNLARVGRWRGWAARTEPLVWILHAGYAWLGVGLALLGLAKLAPGLVATTAGVHGLTAGAMGVMILAMMTRATLGHTGRARVADAATTWLYALINLAALVRVSAPFAPDATPALLTASTVLWAGAFGLYAVRYGPMLARRAVP